MLLILVLCCLWMMSVAINSCCTKSDNLLQNNSINSGEGWVVGLRPIVHLWGLGLFGYTIHRGLSKGSYPVFTQVLVKTTENSEHPGRHARPGIEPGTSRLSALSADPLIPGGASLKWALVWFSARIKAKHLNLCLKIYNLMMKGYEK